MFLWFPVLDLARAPRRTARKKGSGYENAATPYSTSVSVSLYAITARSITNQRTSSGVGIGFTFLPHVIIPDKRHGVHCCIHANFVPRACPFAGYGGLYACSAIVAKCKQSISKIRISRRKSDTFLTEID